jgi:UDP-N-acetylglucosamine 3-dehydrogenase
MRLKVAVVGAGAMGTNHLRVLADFNTEQVELVGVAEPAEQALHAAMQRFHIAGYRDYRVLVEQTRPDLVAVVVPTHLHFEVASYLLDMGINVLLEKPMASTPEEAETLLQLARVRGVMLAIGHIERFNPALVALKQRITAGELGQIFQLHARRLGPFPPRIRDVGVVLDLATHDIDVMRYLVGAEVTRVYAETQRRVHSLHEDSLLGMLRFANGAVGMLDVNWLTPTKVRELAVTGERGMYLVNYLTQDLYFYENDYSANNWKEVSHLTGVSEGTMTRLKVQKVEPLRLQYEDVCTAIRTQSAPRVSGADGLAVLRIAHQLMASTHPQETVGRPTQQTMNVGVRHAG